MQVTFLFCSLTLAAIFCAETAKSVVLVPKYRLPNETYPEHYEIKINTDVHLGRRAFQGEVIIDIAVSNATRNIVLHARQLNIIKVTIVNRFSGTSEELFHEYELEREFLTLTRASGQLFAAETKFKLGITYSGVLLNENGGFLMSEYINELHQLRFLAATQFESTNARQAFPCYDEPDRRANFTITINHSPSYKAISNMPLNEALSSVGKTTFQTTTPIPTYTVAFVVSDFGYTEGVLNGITQRMHSRPTARDSHEWALVTGMLIAGHLSKYFAIKFAYPQTNYVAVPNFSPGVIKRSGMGILNERNLIYDENTSSVFEQTNISKTIAHELSHQWFNNYVTIKSWSYLWLKEGLATLISYRALNKIMPEWDIWQEFYVVHYQRALSSDDSSSSRPMTYYVQTPNEIEGLYDSVSIYKASSVLLMWNNALDDKIFQKGLRNFLTKNQYSAADEELLFAAVDTAVETENLTIPAQISEMLSTWTKQSGFPLLTVLRNYERGTFVVMQSTFLRNEAFPDNKTWYVPINFAVASNADFHDTKATHYLLNSVETEIKDSRIAKEDWLMLNKQSTGFYRVTYDTENWNLIVKALIKNPFRIDTLNRAQLMDDAFHLIMTNRLDHSILLKMLTYLKQEYQYAPLSTAFNIFLKYNHYLGGDSRYNEFKFFVAKQIRLVYKKLGVNDIRGEHRLNKYTRSLVINMACLFELKICLKETNKKLKAHISENQLINPNLVATIYCNGLRQSGDDEFNFLYEKLMNSTQNEMRSKLISYLSCSQNKTHIRKLIYSSIDRTNGLHPLERSSILRWVYQRGEMGLLACIEFLSNRFEDYGRLRSASGNSNPLADDIRGMASFVVNVKQAQILLALVAQVKHSRYVTASLETDVIQKISHNFLWLKYHGEPIMSWIRVNKNKNKTACIATEV